MELSNSIFSELDTHKKKALSYVNGAIERYRVDKKLSHHQMARSVDIAHIDVDSKTTCYNVIFNFEDQKKVPDEIIKVTEIIKYRKIMYRIESQFLVNDPIIVTADCSIGWG